MALQITPVVDPDSLPKEWRWLGNVAVGDNEVWRVLGMCGSLLVILLAGRILRHFLRAAAERLQSHSKQISAVALDSLAQATGFVSLALGLAIRVWFVVQPPASSTRPAATCRGISRG